MVGYLEICYYILLPLGHSEPKHLKQRLSAENLLPRTKGPIQLPGVCLQFSHLFIEQIFIQCLLCARFCSVP